MNLDWAWLEVNHADITALVGVHLLLALLPVVAALILAVPMGCLVYRAGAAADALLVGLGLLSSIPALALLVALPVLSGHRTLGPVTIGLGLTGYAFALLIRRVVEGLRSVPEPVVASASAAGFGRLRRLTRIELPLAMPVVFAGLRVATVSNIALVSVSVLVGQRSLGSLFDLGYRQELITPVLVGLVLCVVLAGFADAAIGVVQRGRQRWRKAATA